MRFPNPATRTCARCGQPTVVAETAIASVRVHCGTWRWQCDTPGEREPARTMVTSPPPATEGEPGLAA